MTHFSKDFNREITPQFLSLEATTGMKRYAFDPVKQRSRERLRDRIESTVLRTKSPENTNVFCLSGIDCVEIFSVYDALKIPRRNITIAEWDPKIAEFIKSQVPECNVVPKSALEVLRGMVPFSLDVISVDYTGTLNDEQEMFLRLIGSENRRPNYLIHHANFLSRDHRSADIYRNIGGNLFAPLEQNREDLGVYVKMLDIRKEFDEAKANKSKLADFKAAAIKNLIITSIRHSSLDHRLFYRRAMLDDDKFGVRLVEELFKEYEGRPITLNPRGDFAMEATLNGNLGFDYGLAVQDTIRVCMKEICKSRVYPDWIGIALFNALSGACSDVNRPHIHSRYGYSYISEKGSPMYGEIQYYRRERRRHEIAKQITGKFLSHGIENIPLFFGQHLELLAEFNALFAPTSIALTSTEVEYLGSSCLPLINRESAIKEFRSGASIDEVTARYRGCKETQLRAWKAHVTRGTYDECEEPERLAKLTDIQAIDMLSVGILAEDILKAWPGSFTLNELEALKKKSPPGASTSDGNIHIE